MKSIFFGSIGSLVECSEIQRKAFNLAFKEYGLDWYWNIANYIKMLKEEKKIYQSITLNLN